MNDDLNVFIAFVKIALPKKLSIDAFEEYPPVHKLERFTERSY